jgi:hypothetical protein
LQVDLYLFEAAAFGFGEEGAYKQEGEHGDAGVAEEGDAGSDGARRTGKVWETANFSTPTCQTPGVLFTARLGGGVPEVELALA